MRMPCGISVSRTEDVDVSVKGESSSSSVGEPRMSVTSDVSMKVIDALQLCSIDMTTTIIAIAMMSFFVVIFVSHEES